MLDEKCRLREIESFKNVIKSWSKRSWYLRVKLEKEMGVLR